MSSIPVWKARFIGNVIEYVVLINIFKVTMREDFNKSKLLPQGEDIAGERKEITSAEIKDYQIGNIIIGNIIPYP